MSVDGDHDYSSRKDYKRVAYITRLCYRTKDGVTVPFPVPCCPFRLFEVGYCRLGYMLQIGCLACALCGLLWPKLCNITRGN